MALFNDGHLTLMKSFISALKTHRNCVVSLNLTLLVKSKADLYPVVRIPQYVIGIFDWRYRHRASNKNDNSGCKSISLTVK